MTACHDGTEHRDRLSRGQGPKKTKNALTYQNLTLARAVWIGERVKRPYKALKDQKYPNIPKPYLT